MPPKRRSNLSRLTKEARRARERRARKYKRYQAKLKRMRIKQATDMEQETEEHHNQDLEGEVHSGTQHRYWETFWQHQSRLEEMHTRLSSVPDSGYSEELGNSHSLHTFGTDQEGKQKEPRELEPGSPIIKLENSSSSLSSYEQSEVLPNSSSSAITGDTEDAPGIVIPDLEATTCQRVKEFHELEHESPLIKAEKLSLSNSEKSKDSPTSSSPSSAFVVNSLDASSIFIQDTEAFTCHDVKEFHELEPVNPIIKSEDACLGSYEEFKESSTMPSSLSSAFIVDDSCSRAPTEMRCVVEMDIGQPKRRFHIFLGEILVNPCKACQIIATCAVPHKICKGRNLLLLEDNPTHTDWPQDYQNDASGQSSTSRAQNGLCYWEYFAELHFGLSTEAEISQDDSIIVKEEFESWHEESIEDCSNQLESLLKESQMNSQSNGKEKDAHVQDVKIIEKYVVTLESLFPLMSRKEIIAALRDVDWNFGLATKNIDEHFKKLKIDKLIEERKRRRQELELAQKRKREKKEKERLEKEEQWRSEKEKAVAQLRTLRGLEPNSPTLEDRLKQFEFIKRRKLEKGREGDLILEKARAMAQLEVLKLAVEATQDHQEDNDIIEVPNTEAKDVNERHSTKSHNSNIKKTGTCHLLRSFRMNRGLQGSILNNSYLKPFPVIYIQEELDDDNDDIINEQ